MRVCGSACVRVRMCACVRVCVCACACCVLQAHALARARVRVLACATAVATNTCRGVAQVRSRRWLRLRTRSLGHVQLQLTELGAALPRLRGRSGALCTYCEVSVADTQARRSLPITSWHHAWHACIKALIVLVLSAETDADFFRLLLLLLAACLASPCALHCRSCAHRMPAVVQCSGWWHRTACHSRCRCPRTPAPAPCAPLAPGTVDCRPARGPI